MTLSLVSLLLSLKSRSSSLIGFSCVASLLSAFSALVYQSLWLRSFSVAFGGSTASVSVVLAVFMAGLALGSLWVRRFATIHVLKTYALAEIGMGLSAILAQLLLLRLPQVLGALSGLLNLSPFTHGLLKASLACAIVLPCAICCGLTLPLLTEALEQTGENEHPGFGRLYTFNTLGAAAGALAAVFILIPNFGVLGSALAASALNGFLALLAFTQAPFPRRLAPLPKEFRGPVRFASVAGISGAVAITLEVLWTRTLTLVLGSSVYAFALMLSSMLLGTALGAALYMARRHRLQNPASLLTRGYLLLALLIPLNAILLGRAPNVYFDFMRHSPPSFGAYSRFGFRLAFATLLPISAVQGFLFPLLLRLSNGEGARRDSATLYLYNTLGAVTGALATGFLLVPYLGLHPNYWIAASLAGVMAALCWPKPRIFKIIAVCLAGLGGFFGARFLNPWNELLVTSGVFQSDIAQLAAQLPSSLSYSDVLNRQYSLSFYKEGAEAVVAARHKPSDGETSLVINGKVDASLHGDVITQTLLAQIPLCLNPEAQTALVIGWGSGCTVGSAAVHPLIALDCVEIEPAVFETARIFQSVNSHKWSKNPSSFLPVWKDPRFKIRFDDARQDLLRHPQKYDVIISEPSNPWISGVSNLFTLDFYQLARKRLNSHGIFCQWFHFYNLDPEDLRRQLRTFAQAFPKTSLWMVPQKDGELSLSGDLIILGSDLEPALDSPAFIGRLESPDVARDLASANCCGPDENRENPTKRDRWWFRSLRLLGDQDLRRFAGLGPLNTDNRPLLEFSAPRSMYRQQSDNTNSSFLLFRTMEAASLELPLSKLMPRSQQLALLGSHYSHRNFYRKAILCLAEAELSAALSPQQNLDLGLAYFFENRSAEAEPRLRRAFLALPKRYVRFLQGAGTYLNLGRPEMALGVFEMALRIKPLDADSHYGRGVCLARLGRREEAITAVETALRLRPELRVAKKMLEALRQKP
jgi:spermidine synthase